VGKLQPQLPMNPIEMEDTISEQAIEVLPTVF
jgi:hypothetical protein